MQTFVDAFQEQAAHLRLKAADRPLQDRALRNHIACVSAMKCANCDYRGIGRIRVSGHDRLQRDNQLTGDKRGVDRVVGRGAVAAFSKDCQCKHVGRRPKRPRLDNNLIIWKPTPQMQSVGRRRLRRLERTVFDHGHRAAQTFLGRLKDQFDPSRQFVAMPRQQLRNTHPDRGVAVMPAGVHNPRVF